MNEQLFYSSIIIGIIIALISIKCYKCELLPLYIITYIGIITSMINHRITNDYAKWLDRFMMCITAIVYYHYVLQIKNENIKNISLCVIYLMILLYLSSKLFENTNIHLITHVLSLLLFSLLTDC
uniref:Uncharacterized protein n=1 Tax=viral metagenome TaxID=1070528 RepID=A0A6C0D9Y2_9ZZZZ